MKKILILDYGLGNLFSVKHACDFLNIPVIITSDKRDLIDADGIILPGVGAFGEAMANLRKLDLIEPLKDFISSNKPFLGVCLGMQLLFSESEEFGFNKGLGIIEGVVKRFPDRDNKNQMLRVPQIAWNRIYSPDHNHLDWKNSPLSGIDNGSYMYFVHSYYCLPENSQDILSKTNYMDFEYCSGIARRSLFAMQFHPEKSAYAGITIYKNFHQSI